MVKVFLGNMPFGDEAVIEAGIRSLFQKVILKKGYGFLDFPDQRDAEEAARVMHDVEFRGRRLRVSLAHTDGERNRNQGPGGGSSRSVDRPPPVQDTHTSLFVANIPSDTTIDRLKDFFEKFGRGILFVWTFMVPPTTVVTTTIGDQTTWTIVAATPIVAATLPLPHVSPVRAPAIALVDVEMNPFVVRTTGFVHLMTVETVCSGMTAAILHATIAATFLEATTAVIFPVVTNAEVLLLSVTTDGVTVHQAFNLPGV
ncbi:hypothetical protein DYB36_000580 [Aphanomyces astaci]|uniref:RRM domain-containing protein n=1 Tax=Aphanomyces astaci TaxID=112090 RepID=A0A397A7E8_APHAT|nr:hypothetical protein DYB36_000580 [Aphanomyces astaci]